MNLKDTKTILVGWFEDNITGIKGYFAEFPDGSRRTFTEETIGHSGPASASTDYDVIAHAVAGELSLGCLSVERDGEFIHATMRQL